MNWNTVLTVQVFVWLIVLFEWKRLKKLSKADKITFASLIIISVLLSFLNLESLSGPITLLQYILGPFGKMME